MTAPLLVVGELIVDFTLTAGDAENKLRLGGIAHAARGLWAVGAPYAVAAVCPTYLIESARSYLKKFGCEDFILLGEVTGAPNVIVIGDPLEVGAQGYEDLLRDEKKVHLHDCRSAFESYENALFFPGAYDLADVCRMLPDQAGIHMDIAYGVKSIGDLKNIGRKIETVIISTSSDLFLEVGSNGIDEFAEAVRPVGPNNIVLKENRGGTRIRNVPASSTFDIPALLGKTVNSVGVGDAYSAVFVTLLSEGLLAAGMKAARVASAYAQTTYPDGLKDRVKRSLALSVEQMVDLGGTLLPWEERPKLQIYLAAPDFSYVDRTFIEKAASSLAYHNFRVCRPVQENGEVPLGSDLAVLQTAYAKDVDLLERSDAVFAIPTLRDPGTLVEIGMAVTMNKPVIVFDPKNECPNTMVIAGATYYSTNLEECLTALFEALSDKRARKNA